MCMAIPPKYPVASAIGFLKGKSAIAMARLCGKERNFTGEHHLNQGANAVRVAVRRHRGEAKSRASLGPCEVEDLRMYRTSANCAFCHGLGARGGGRGPDLSRAQKRHGNSDADLFRTINEGVPGTAMPHNGATQQGVGMTEEEIWQVISYIRSVQVKAPAQPAGNAAHGKELFNGSAACSTCHMIQGKGGRLGPDLSTTASARSTDYLVESVRSPSRRLAQGISEAMKEFSQEYETVTVVTADGTKFT